MKLALQKTYDAIPAPKIVIADGACAIGGGPFVGHEEVNDGATDLLPIDLLIPGAAQEPRRTHLTVCTIVHILDRGVRLGSRKAVINLRKHGVDFADSGTVLHDERAITIHDEGSNDEDRFVTLGMDALGRVLVLVYTWREDRPRLISSRKATPRERRQYEGVR